MDLDVAAGVVTTVDLIEIEATDLTHRTVYLYRHLSILPASLVGDVLDDPLAAFTMGDHRLVDIPVRDSVYVEDTKRIVKQAAKAGLVFGRIFFAEPDFEIENFEPEELGEVLWHWIQEYESPGEAEGIGRTDEAKCILLNAVRGAQSNTEFFEKAREALMERAASYGEGQEWGRRLTLYAVGKPDKESDERRQFVAAVEDAFKSVGANYTKLRQTHEVDPDTGRLVPKK